MPVASIYPKYPSKWDRAKKAFDRRCEELDNNGLATIEYFSGQALHYQRLAKEDPAGTWAIRSSRCDNAATYGLNLAFGIDLAKK